MDMRLAVGLAVLLATSWATADEASNRKPFVGRFRSSVGGMLAHSIELRVDGSFIYRVSGDVGPPRETEGKWEVVRENLIELTSYEGQAEATVTARHEKDQHDSKVAVLLGGLPVPGVTVVLTCKSGGRRSVITGADGVARAEKCLATSFAATLPGFESGLWRGEPEEANSFEVNLVATQFVLDHERFYLLDDALHGLDFGIARVDR